MSIVARRSDAFDLRTLSWCRRLSSSCVASLVGRCAPPDERFLLPNTRFGPYGRSAPNGGGAPQPPSVAVSPLGAPPDAPGGAARLRAAPDSPERATRPGPRCAFVASEKPRDRPSALAPPFDPTWSMVGRAGALIECAGFRAVGDEPVGEALSSSDDGDPAHGDGLPAAAAALCGDAAAAAEAVAAEVGEAVAAEVGESGGSLEAGVASGVFDCTAACAYSSFVIVLTPSLSSLRRRGARPPAAPFVLLMRPRVPGVRPKRRNAVKSWWLGGVSNVVSMSSPAADTLAAGKRSCVKTCSRSARLIEALGSPPGDRRRSRISVALSSSAECRSGAAGAEGESGMCAPRNVNPKRDRPKLGHGGPRGSLCL